MGDDEKKAKKVLKAVLRPPRRSVPVMVPWGEWQIIPHNGDKKSITEYDNIIHYVQFKWQGLPGNPPFKM